MQDCVIVVEGSITMLTTLTIVELKMKTFTCVGREAESEICQ